jgi:restriction system protein
LTFPPQRSVELPLLQEILRAGGEARPRDLYPAVAGHFPDLTPEDQELRLESSPSTKKWANLVQWARQHLIDRGEIDGATRGLWRITNRGKERIGLTAAIASPPPTDRDSGEFASGVTLRDLLSANADEVRARLLTELKALTPTGFERFCQALLLRLGFASVEVTRRSGDGGLDGFGDFRQGAVSIKSAFQAKRWLEKPVGRPDVDQFRGAIQGEYDHGVFITTSRFSSEARDASYKKGAITILLLDGSAIADLMVEYGIGCSRQPVFLLDVDPVFFDFDDQ